MRMFIIMRFLTGTPFKERHHACYYIQSSGDGRKRDEGRHDTIIDSYAYCGSCQL